MKKTIIILRHAGENGVQATKIADDFRRKYRNKNVAVLVSSLKDAKVTAEAFKMNFPEKVRFTPVLAGPPIEPNIPRVMRLVQTTNAVVIFLVTHQDYAETLPAAFKENFEVIDSCNKDRPKPGEHTMLQIAVEEMAEA